MKKAVVLLSGGIDSGTALFKAKKEGYELYTLSLNYGHKAQHELECAEMLLELAGVKEHKSIDLNSLKDVFKSPLTDMDIKEEENERTGDSYYIVPLRNTVFLSIASAYAQSIGADKVVIGNHKEDAKGFPDTTKEAMETLQVAINAASEKGKEVELSSPWIDMDKDEIIKLGIEEYSVPYEKTYSCYEKDIDKHCGKCESCIYRANSFAKLGYIDPAPYIVYPLDLQSDEYKNLKKVS